MVFKYLFFIAIVAYLVFLASVLFSTATGLLGVLVYIVIIAFSIFAIYRTSAIIDKTYPENPKGAALVLLGAILLYIFANVGLCTLAASFVLQRS